MINNLFSPFYCNENNLVKATVLHKSLLLLNCSRLRKSEATGKMGITDFEIKKYKTSEEAKSYPDCDLLFQEPCASLSEMNTISILPLHSYGKQMPQALL